MLFYIDMSHCEWAVCGYEGFFVLLSLLYVGVVRFVIRLNYPWLQEGVQVRLVGSASMDGFVSQLTLLVRGWGGRVVRSMGGFGLPGDYSEMSLPFL